ncbi:glycosyltransferase family 2 protein [Butyrivibrio sp. VCB2006]|uniref:glycosyltransferase family 2 protein n=1 Tax=Butyrivibrio sp. VCB2006 TaxID=1280679 RepID=UPI0004255C27|nr:glycosyltransferase family 2 protein [Butyrivibrio sp. VCB2006]
MSTPKVSIIIPVYNTAKYLENCIKSVLEQTMPEIEIILVDDGSTDNVSPKMCDDYAAKDNRIRVIHKENGGLMSAWIRGTREACSPYVCYVDSDDWIDADMVESLYKHTRLYQLENDKNSSTEYAEDFFAAAEIISSNYIVEKAGERRKETQAQAPGEYVDKELDLIRSNFLGNEVRPVTMSRCMKLITRQLVLGNIKYCNEKIKMAEDVNIMLPCLCDCRRLVIVEGGYFYHYRLVGDSIVHGYDKNLLNNLNLTDTTYRKIMQEKGIFNGQEQLDREYVIMLFVVLKNELRCPDKDTVKRVRNIFLREDIRKKVLETKITVSSKANKLLYMCMKNPNALMIGITKAILHVYDVKTNS